jgi:hypothetical protein
MGRSRGLNLNSPTFPRRPRGNSDASSMKNDLEPGFSANEIGEEESEINGEILYEEPLENDIMNDPATPASKPEIQKYEISRSDTTRHDTIPTPDPYSLQEASANREQVYYFVCFYILIYMSYIY